MLNEFYFWNQDKSVTTKEHLHVSGSQVINEQEREGRHLDWANAILTDFDRGKHESPSLIDRQTPDHLVLLQKQKVTNVNVRQ